MLNFFDLTGEVAFVTGASKGLGKMFANTLAQAGAKVCLLSFEKEDLLRTEQEMKDAGYDVMSYYADITNEPEVEAAVAACVEKYGTIDILVNKMCIRDSYYTGERLVLINQSPTQYDKKADLLIKEKIGTVFSAI